MRIFYCCIIYRSNDNTMRKTTLKTSKSSIKDLKTSNYGYDDTEALSAIARSVSMASG